MWCETSERLSDQQARDGRFEASTDIAGELPRNNPIWRLKENPDEVVFQELLRR